MVALLFGEAEVAMPWQLRFLFVSMPLGGGCWQCFGNGVSGVMGALINSLSCK